MPFHVEPLDIIIIMLAALLFFGPNRLPEIGRGVGKAIGEFRRGITGAPEEPRTQMPRPADARPVQDPIQPGGENTCAQCGQANVTEARFCHYCGAQLAHVGPAA